MKTKLDRAIEQTLRRWEEKLDRTLGIKTNGFLVCGFCKEYQFEYTQCGSCPVYKIEKGHCNFTVVDNSGIVGLPIDSEKRIPGILAILVYVHGFKQ
jgi:hypothetical protein